MTDFTPVPQQAAAVSSTVDQTVAAPLEADHSQGEFHFHSSSTSCTNFDYTAAPIFSFDDEPLFEVDGSALPPDDFFSSPEWTDPSPALSMAMSFAVDSCDTSPLLTDNYDAPDFSGVPLFGTDYYSVRSPQNAFNSTNKDINEESGLLLLRALNKHSIAQDADVKRDSSTSIPLTASPNAISSPAPFNRPLFSPSTSSESLVDRHSFNSGIKRRRDTTELLPMDAPIQPRKYLAPSKTSRKEFQDLDFEAEVAAEEIAIAAEKNPLLAKRRQNTLAARRSRHRKAAELQELHDTIDELRNEKEMWKARCLRLEKNLES